MTHTLVFDIGKTRAKAVVFDAALAPVASEGRANTVLGASPYPQLDVAGIWRWMIGSMRAQAACFPVSRVCVATHGATAALVDPSAGEDGLVLPVLDYEHDAPARENGYEALRPPFAETLSPSLPAGLNLGRQLHWQSRHFPRSFARAGLILMYPQYWTWRLSGVAVGECSSLGCHTDLWSPRARGYSALPRSQGWERLLPPLRAAREPCGPLRNGVAALTGLPADCVVHTGVHDSNAGYARHLAAARGAPFVLVSTGTWVVCMAAGGHPTRLDPGRDMLANVDVDGDAVPCARFMGGREYALICERLGSSPEQPAGVDDVRAVVAAGVYALPDFSGGSGPFGGRPARIVGRPANAAALATLYAALMIDQLLDLLGARGEILIEGAFVANPVLCGLVAALRGRAVRLGGAGEASALGAALLCNPRADARAPRYDACEPCAVMGLDRYRECWRAAAAGAHDVESGRGACE